MGRGLAAAATGAALVLLCAPAGSAAPPNPPVVTEGSIAVALSPGGTNPPLLAGHFHVDDPNAQTTVNALMSWTGPDPDHHQKFDPQSVCPGPQCINDPNAGNVDFNGFKLPDAPYNGPYRVDATASARNVFGTGTGTAATPFSVAIPPPTVKNVNATANKDRQVAVSWDRDTATPDVFTYYIWRKGPDDKDFRAISQTPQSPVGTRMTIPDDLSHSPGGDYLYQIEERRNGPTGDSSSFVASDRSKSQSNKITMAPLPPGTPTTPTQPGPKGPGAPPPVIKSSPSGVRTGQLSSGATTPTSEAVTPDPGFVRGLPFANRGKQGDDEGDPSVALNTPGGRHKSNQKGVLTPVAIGAILFVGAFQLRWLKKRLDEPAQALS